MKVQSINPATDELLGEFELYDFARVEKAFSECKTAQQEWSRLSVEQRIKPLMQLAKILRTDAESIGKLATIEMGKPIAQSKAEVEKCGLVCEYYAGHAKEFLQPECVATEAKKSYVRFDALGILLAIMPWNFPYWQVFRAVIPAITAGNGILLKHASNVPQCSLKIQELFEHAGYSKGLFQSLLIDSAAAQELIEKIDAVTLTGSTSAGSAVAANAGKHIKKIVLELGGSDAFIVLADADLEAAAHAAVLARNQNAGQSCIAAKRFLIMAEVYEEFKKRVLTEYAKLTVGDPLDPEVEMGPLAKKEFRDQLESQIQDAVKKGARIVYGGKRIGDRGAFLQPTIIESITPAMRIYSEETFGPIMSLYKILDGHEGVEIANASVYGLGASLWTKNMILAERLAAELKVGAVFVNAMVKSDPRMPFGGVKKSGFGRELSHYGLREFVNVKSVVIPQ